MKQACWDATVVHVFFLILIRIRCSALSHHALYYGKNRNTDFQSIYIYIVIDNLFLIVFHFPTNEAQFLLKLNLLSFIMPEAVATS